MANLIDDLLGSELNLLFFISAVVWILIFFYIYYTNNKLKNLEKELDNLKEESEGLFRNIFTSTKDIAPFSNGLL